MVYTARPFPCRQFYPLPCQNISVRIVLMDISGSLATSDRRRRQWPLVLHVTVFSSSVPNLIPQYMDWLKEERGSLRSRSAVEGQTETAAGSQDMLIIQWSQYINTDSIHTIGLLPFTRLVKTVSVYGPQEGDFSLCKAQGPRKRV